MVTRRRGRQRKQTSAEAGAEFDQQCVLAGLPVGEPERVFHPIRKWRLDRYWYPWQVALEIEGGLFKGKRQADTLAMVAHTGARLSVDELKAMHGGGGRHNRAAGMREDLIKYNEATSRDILVIRVMPEMVRDGRALTWIEAALKSHGWKPEPRRKAGSDDQVNGSGSVEGGNGVSGEVGPG